MRRLITYYKRILTQKYLYYKVGKAIGVSLSSRLFHNFDLLNPRLANEVSKLIYTKEGYPRARISLSDAELDRLDSLIYSHKSRSTSCIEFWLKTKLKDIPEEYIRRFLADRYADCGLDTNKFLSSNRDLFFAYDNQEHSYSSQVRSILESLILDSEVFRSK